MIEIKKLLYKKKIQFIDKNLSWGAKLSDYHEIIVQSYYYHLIYGIELISDIPAPENYRIIDHHNQLSQLPSSLEQVAEILGIKLNRYQKLVAANDKGYIPEMIKNGATTDEIEKIRRSDRKSQGVTKSDEFLGIKSIHENCKIINNVAVIRSLTYKFSPITDRLFGKYNKLIIYTEKNLCYYGKGIIKLINQFQDNVKNNNAYYGGGENGFFGFADFTFSATDIQNKIIPQIIKLVEHE
ncbi:MAG: hypothetical protein GX437_05540 [Sphingobacteriales bacterium]|nr:hypothetical protein [Sphingobacteriales bacterium]